MRGSGRPRCVTDKSTSSKVLQLYFKSVRDYIYYPVVGVEGAGRGGRGIYITDKYE
jgi:hypothetical protein